MHQDELIPHLFRTEFRKIVSVLCKRLGTDQIEIAEDIASETFLLAMETWSFKGIPENPVAWFYTVAKNKTNNHIARQKIFDDKVSSEIKVEDKCTPTDLDFSEKNINDSQLQMLFALCHPSIPAESQIGLSLRLLCGFGIQEIADAFLTNKETINKRLFRAKEILREEKIKIEIPDGQQIEKRLDTVLTTLYLLFNEGYYSESNDAVIRKDLCVEAMRLTYLLLDHAETNLSQVNALFALMCFHSSRLDARRNKDGEMILYDEQDESLWNQDLIAKGNFHLHEASTHGQLSKYHLEASIAYWHTIKTDSKEKWETILQLYNRLLQIEYSPVAALNRTYALAKANGVNTAIGEAEKLGLDNNHYYFTLLGELYKTSDPRKSLENFEKALALAKTRTDRQTIQKKIDLVMKSTP